MGYYDKCEQETVYVYDPVKKRWRVYSTYPPDIKTILERSREITRTETDENGLVVAVDSYVDRSQIRLYKDK
ncbi:MAG TPA: hypothetical protein VNM69_00495 [Bacillus sp. (in: firmicutes)]|uniref:hypothetical protein n=1 Tax=Bacillus litorisediminis TaxID=2922713 RepID=UPI001FAF4B60|nr:hypothetical protein [Bacillus litorisediminis]HWO74374.1 hypothetical protein [Bacillus sp. (in: firmicutes)]